MNSKNFFFIDGHKVETDQDRLSGLRIKELGHGVDPNINVNDELVLEGAGNDKDRLIGDDEGVDVTHGHGQGPKHFATRPRTTFGGC